MPSLPNGRYQWWPRAIVIAAIAASIVGCETSGIDFALKPLKATRNADGSYLAEVAVSKHDDWSWDEIEITGQIVTPMHTEMDARLVSDPPSNPVPNRFVLKFQTAAIETDGEPVNLKVKIKVRASKNAGLSSASRSMSELVKLKSPQSSASEAGNVGSSESG